MELKNKLYSDALLKSKIIFMRQIIAGFFIFGSLLAWNVSTAQNSPESVADSFFTIYKNSGCEKAMDWLFAGNKYKNEIRQAIVDVTEKIKLTADADGVYCGHQLLFVKKAGPDFVMLTYLVKYEKEPLTFRLLFYKPQEKWQVQDFKFDNKMDEELDEASKARNFKNID